VSGFLDTSMVVRYLTGDPPDLADLAGRVIDGDEDGDGVTPCGPDGTADTADDDCDDKRVGGPTRQSLLSDPTSARLGASSFAEAKQQAGQQEAKPTELGRGTALVHGSAS